MMSDITRVAFLELKDVRVDAVQDGEGVGGDLLEELGVGGVEGGDLFWRQ